MNLILFEHHHRLDETTIRLDARQTTHIRKVLNAQPGAALRIGELNGKIGTGKLISIHEHSAIVEIEHLNSPPPKSLPVTLIIGLPRPKMVKRVLQCATAMGVKRFHFINSYKVEKSFWSSPWLGAPKIYENLRLGLEQAGDTIMPTVEQHKLFKPFVEDKLASIGENTIKLVAHPYAPMSCPTQLDQAATLVVGPEGGFIPYEIEKLQEQGFEVVKMGERILRVETAIPALLAKLFAFA